MKLNEFTDRLYAMGDIETSTLNENWADELDYYADKVSADLYKYEGNKKFDRYVDKILSKAEVSNIGDLEIKDLKKISKYADKLYGDTYEEEEEYYPEFFESLTEGLDSYMYDIDAVINEWQSVKQYLNNNEYEMAKKILIDLEDSGMLAEDILSEI